VDANDRFAEQLSAVDHGDGSVSLLDLAQRYAYVVPGERSLSLLGELGPIVEMGAGTGYWAYRLRARGVDVIAYDLAPPDGERANRYHAPTATWGDVVAADHAILAGHSDRALFLCWPPLFSSLGDCLDSYNGNTVALIGDGGHRTARLRGLDEAFSAISVTSVRALEPFPGATPTLTIWRRHSTG
jgi:hypothetical protein